MDKFKDIEDGLNALGGNKIPYCPMAREAATIDLKWLVGEVSRLRKLERAVAAWYKQGPATDWRQDEALRAVYVESAQRSE